MLEHFTNAIKYLNQSLPQDLEIKYVAWDMARASKSPDQDVVGTLENYAKEFLEATNIFFTGNAPYANAIRKAK